MKKLSNHFCIALAGLISINLAVASVNAQEVKEIKTIQYAAINPLELIAQPQNYIDKNIKISAVFNKFSTLGLDYKPAFKDSQEYISFLIKRQDISKSTIPLSEMKIVIKRKLAEKNLLDIESGDKIEFTGKVFSCALNDPWIEVESIKILTPKTKKVANKTENK